MVNSASFAVIEDTFTHNESIKILSLDCFDTLFWRRVAKPADIFYTLDVDVKERIDAERQARMKKLLHGENDEVSIYDIYAELVPGASAQDIENLVGQEIAREIKHGYVFDSALNILKLAKQRNIKTIIVSDIYYNAKQLGQIIESVSPEAFKLIDTIYCSSQHGVGKTNGLWKKVLEKENVKPKNIFHVGDNIKADYTAPTKLGVTANHFLQHEKTVSDVLSLRENAALVALPECRKSAAIPSVFHDWYSVHARENMTAEKILGCTVIGPILNVFAQHIQRQVINKPGTKIAFLLRDGYMPKLAYDTLYPEEETYQLRISRLTSIRSSFYDKASIESYLIETFTPMLQGRIFLKFNLHQVDVLCKHLFIDDAEKNKLLKELKACDYSIHYLISSVLAKKISQVTIAKSAEFRARLIKHLQRETGIKAGETLLLVDLGYAGTTQNKLAPILEKELDIKIEGCYLIVSPTSGWQKNRTGVVAPDRYDHRVISTLTTFIAAFEILSSSNDFSVADYEEDGTPTGKTDISEAHFARIRAAQQHALDFIRSNKNALRDATFSREALSDSVIIDLARYIYFPLPEEMQWLEQLQFEINLGTNEKIAYIDRDKAIDFVRMYGVSRIINGDIDELRTNYSAELRYLGMENAIWLMTTQRYAVGYPIVERILRKQALEVLFVINGNAVARNIDALYTYDGFYSLNIPLVNDSDVVVMIGKLCNKIEILNIGFVPDINFSNSTQNSASVELMLNGDYFIDSASVDGNIITSANESAFIYVKKSQAREQGIINITYRPLL